MIFIYPGHVPQGEPSKGVWLDYILVIATGDYVDTALKEANMLDYTREFIEKCSMNHYYIAPNATGKGCVCVYVLQFTKNSSNCKDSHLGRCISAARS